MAPIFDLFNHQVKPNCDWTTIDQNVEIQAVNDVNPGEELFVSYGHGSNKELLMNHGFTLSGTQVSKLSLTG